MPISQNINIPKSVYHYTGIETLWILLSKLEDSNREKYFNLHLHSIANMNDYTEGTTGTQVLINALKTFKEEKYLEIITNLDEEKLEAFNNIFVTSFSTVHDDLNLWRSYGCDSYGVCIEFDSEYLKEISDNIPDCAKSNHSMRFAKVDYVSRSDNDVDKLSKLTNELSVSAISYIEDYLKGVRAFLKNEYFKSEDEYRFMINNALATDKTKTKYSLEYKYNNGAIVPYVKLKLPLSAIKRITLGPSKACKQSEEVLRNYLDTIITESMNGLEPNLQNTENTESKNIRVDRSAIPYVPK